jgi:23S rRNA pseudouridine2605 synthase
MTMMRLQKFLANAGVSSRRKAEELIAGGKVKVNGQVVTELGTKIDDAKDIVAVSGKTIKSAEQTWIALHKPRGYVSTRNDPQGRPTVYDLLPPALHGLFYVGRLDMDSEGLLLLTNDGDTANRLLHPRYEVERVYEVLVRGEVKPDKIQMLLDGVELEDGTATAQSVRVLGVVRNEMRLRLTLREGKKREVRRMLWAVGHKVLELKRIRYGPIELGRLPEAKWRKLTEAELESLRGRPRAHSGARKGPAKRGRPAKRGATKRGPSARDKYYERPSKRDEDSSEERGPTPRVRPAANRGAAFKHGATKRAPTKRAPTKRAPTKRAPASKRGPAPRKRTKRD